MKNKTLLYFNRILAFIAFLATFGKIFYDYGVGQGVRQVLFEHYGTAPNYIADFTMLFVFAAFYLALLIISHWFVGAVFYSPKPYIIVAIISVGFITLMWAVFGLEYLFGDPIEGFTTSDIIYDCIITITSLAIGFIYFLSAFKFKAD